MRCADRVVDVDGDVNIESRYTCTQDHWQAYVVKGRKERYKKKKEKERPYFILFIYVILSSSKCLHTNKQVYSLSHSYSSQEIISTQTT